MSDSTSPFAMLPRELPGEEAAREERHQLLATLLGAFADGELPAETASQIDAHLLGCMRCRNELQVHRVLRLRLEQEPPAAASAALRSRITAAIAAAPAPQWESIASAVPAAPRRHAARRWRIGLAIGGLAAITLIVTRQILPVGAPATLNTVSSTRQPLLRDVLNDYRRVTAGDLPGRARDLDAVRAAIAFPVQVSQHPQLRLLAAWTTTIAGEPAAVLAYRWNDQVVLQYVLSDQQVYRSADLRAALAGGSGIATGDGPLHAVGWAEEASASLVVGNLPTKQLESLREGRPPR